MSQEAEYSWRQIAREEFPLVREMMRSIVAEEAFYTLPAHASDEDCMAYWFGGQRNETWLLEENGRVVGSYYLRANHFELGGHIANAGYMVSSHTRNKGVGRLLGEHSINRARECGFRGIQFNFVVATNTVAVKLWQSLGFSIIGTIPGGFHYRHQRYDDAYIMFKDLRI